MSGLGLRNRVELIGFAVEELAGQLAEVVGNTLIDNEVELAAEPELEAQLVSFAMRRNTPSVPLTVIASESPGEVRRFGHIVSAARPEPSEFASSKTL